MPCVALIFRPFRLQGIFFISIHSSFSALIDSPIVEESMEASLHVLHDNPGLKVTLTVTNIYTSRIKGSH